MENEIVVENEYEPTAKLPVEVVKAMRKELIPLFEKRLNARRLLPVVNVPMRAREHGYDIQLGDNSQDAEIVAPGGDIPRDTPDGRKRIMNTIQKLARGYEIPREDYMNETYLTRTVLRAVRKVAELDDNLIINGDAVSGVVGLVDIPAGTVGPGEGTWDDASADGATPYHDMISLLSQLRSQSDNGFGQNPKALSVVIDPITETNLYMTHLAEAEKGQVTMDRIERLFGRVEVVPSMPSGKVLLMETGKEIGELILAEDLTIERAGYKIEKQTYLGNIYSRLVPVWYRHGDVEGQSTAVAELDGVL